MRLITIYKYWLQILTKRVCLVSIYKRTRMTMCQIHNCICTGSIPAAANFLCPLSVRLPQSDRYDKKVSWVTLYVYRWSKQTPGKCWEKRIFR